MDITKKDMDVEAAYEKAVPRQFGDLHQRMKYLIEKARDCGMDRLHDAPGPPEYPKLVDLWNAIWDLQTEVSHHQPARPPYGKRIVRRGR